MKRIYRRLKKKKINWLVILVVVLSSFTIDWLTIGQVKKSQSPTRNAAEEETVLISRVIDGDTIITAAGQTIRYIGINAPEIRHYPGWRPDECFGRVAKEENTRLVLGKKVRLEKDVSQTDKYGRLLRYVWLDGKMINMELVRNGFAHAATFPPDVKYQKQFLQAERQARENNLGLWEECR